MNDLTGDNGKSRIVEVNERTEQVPTSLTPICPHCGIDPARLTAVPLQMGPVQALVFFCGACRKILSVEVIGIEQPRIVRPM